MMGMCSPLSLSKSQLTKYIKGLITSDITAQSSVLVWTKHLHRLQNELIRIALNCAQKSVALLLCQKGVGQLKRGQDGSL